jgi:hypothetical protein
MIEEGNEGRKEDGEFSGERMMGRSVGQKGWEEEEKGETKKEKNDKVVSFFSSLLPLLPSLLPLLPLLLPLIITIMKIKLFFSDILTLSSVSVS